MSVSADLRERTIQRAEIHLVAAAEALANGDHDEYAEFWGQTMMDFLEYGA